MNAAQPRGYVYADGYGFGGLTALACASTPVAVRLLLARGAEPNDTYIPPQYEDNLQDIPILHGHLARRSGEVREAIVSSLIQHGADVNRVAYAPASGGQDTLYLISPTQPPTSYWPQVVLSRDVVWARELLVNHGADANWPRSEDEEWKEWSPGAPTVLLLAILGRDKPMVELLLSHGADPALPECIDVSFLSVRFSSSADEILEAGYFSDEQVRHYFGGAVADGEYEFQPDSRATPSSVAQEVGDAEIIALLESHGAPPPHPANAKVPYCLWDVPRK